MRRGGRRLPYSRTSGEQNLRKKTGKKRLTSGRLYGNINIALRNSAVQPLARVVELVDSLASGASARKGVRVRLPPRAPKSRNNLDIVGCKSTVPRCCGFFIFKISEVQKKMPNRNFLNRMDLNSGFRLFETQGSSGRPFSSQKGRLRTEKLYTKNRAPVCWYQRINRPGFFVFRRK